MIENKEEYKKQCKELTDAKKGRDRCYDGSFWIIGFCFNYTNWRYDQ